MMFEGESVEVAASRTESLLCGHHWRVVLSVVIAIILVMLVGLWGVAPKGGWESIRDALLWGNRSVNGGTGGSHNGFWFSEGAGTGEWAGVANYSSYPSGVSVERRENYASFALLLNGIRDEMPPGSKMGCTNQTDTRVYCTVRSNSRLLGSVGRGRVTFNIDREEPFVATGHIEVDTGMFGSGWTL